MKMRTTTREAGENLAHILDALILKWGADYARANGGRPANIEVVAEAVLVVLENVINARPDIAGLVIDKLSTMRFLSEMAQVKASTEILKG